MAKFKLTLRNSLTFVLAFLGSIISPNVFSQDVDTVEGDDASPKTAGKDAKESANKLIKLGIKKVDYIEILNSNTLKKVKNKKEKFKIFIAYYLNNIRLIDNI